MKGMMQRHTLQDLLHRTMTGEETFYIASEFDPLVKLWTDQEAVIGALRIDLAGRDKRIAELETAVLDGIEWADEQIPPDVFKRMKKACGL